MTIHKLITTLLGVIAAAIMASLSPVLAVGSTPQNTPPSSYSTECQLKLNQFWERAKIETDKSVLEILAQDQTERERGLRYGKIIRGNPARKEIAITFDDGPHPQYTPKLLDILKANNVKATFFLVGEMAVKYPDLVHAEMAAGHSVGNHTYHHVNLTKVPLPDVSTEIQACGDVLESITGKKPSLFRPPGGDYDKAVATAANNLGYTMVLWTDDPGDYTQPGEKTIENRILSTISNGGIILIHDGIQQTVDLLPQLLTYLKQQGYVFVTVDQMLQEKHVLR